jgi:8-oxo-dGTP pyrophosphatase MutT (NUDIX family)
MSKAIVRHKWFSICEGKYGVPFVDMEGTEGVLVVALDDHGNLLLLSEYSAAYNRRVYFLPAGRIDPGEISTATANRELQEEAGFTAARLDRVGEVYPFIKYLRGHLEVYLARDLAPGKLEGDEEWEIYVELTPFNRFEELIDAGRLEDSSVIAALYMARRFLDQEGDPK